VQSGLGSDMHAHHLFVIKLAVDDMRISRNEFVLEMRAKNIGASIHYSPLHKMPLYYLEGQTLPSTEYLSQRIVTLPISASMSVEDAKDVCDALASTLD
jgi:dTDP-4-amino-4,6-dideoxygalactose transaminase